MSVDPDLYELARQIGAFGGGVLGLYLIIGIFRHTL